LRIDLAFTTTTIVTVVMVMVMILVIAKYCQGADADDDL
jgi:hypothetical protein